MDFSQADFIKIGQGVDQERQKLEQQREKFKVEAPPEVYSMFENILSTSENPEEEIYRLGTAYTFSENLGIPIGEAYSNLDTYTEAVYGKPIAEVGSYKNVFSTIGDSFYIGRIQSDIARLGNELRQAELEGNTEVVESLYKELETYQNEISVRSQGLPQEGLKGAISQVSQSLPYMLDNIAVGALGNLIVPGLGTLASGIVGTNYYSGQEYLDLRQQGASVEGANKASLISGGIQAIVELFLGNIAGAAADITGAKTLSKSISKKVGDALKTSPAWKKVLSNIARYGANATEEGLEEVLQEATSLITETVLANSEGYDLDRESIAKTLWENFKGGFTGSLILGGLPLTANTVATVSDYKKIREMAINIESEKMFENAVKDSVVFNGMEENEKTETIKNIWETYQANRDEVFNQRVKEQAEVTDTASGYDTEIDAEYRQDGRLYTEDRQNEDGKNVFVIGNPDKEGSNLYGHIDYSIDGDTITIENFKMNENREALRTEMFQEFAEQHPGMKIEWETVGKIATDIKNKLIANNPYGKENGLNYYKDEQSVYDAQTRRKVAEEIGKNFKFDNKQKSAAVFVLEAMANSQGKNLTEYVGETFGREIFGKTEEIERLANLQNETFQGKAGATRWFGRDMKAVIYAGEKGDFSTWVHELSHVYQRQLSGDLLTQAEKAFNVKNGDWHNSTYTFTNSKGKKVTYTSDEAFAYGFQDWLQTGKAPNQELKNIFEKFAEFLARCYNSLKDHLNMSKDIIDVYNQMLKGDDSMLALAERAVLENDRKRLADERIKQQQLEAEQQQKAQEEKAEEQARQEELAETTIKDESSENDIPVIPVEELVKAFEPHEETVKTLDDTSKSKTEKDKAVLESASEDMEEMELLFQMVGEESIRQMATSTYKQEKLSNLEKAKHFYNGMYKNLDPKIRALRIKLQTGWENDNGKWKYETDDSISKFNWEGRFAEVFKLAPRNLVETLNARNITIGDMIVHDELFNIFPWLKDVNVKFTNRLDTLVTSMTDEGILINLAHVKDVDIRKTLGHQMQHLIQGVEHSNSGFTGKNFKKLYATLNKAITSTVTEEELSEIERLGNDYFNNDAEIEARNVAERYNMISRDRASNPINFQLIGEQGAEQLDIAEETTVRMDNLNIAMHMEANGNTPKEIRLATSWERGADGQWKYEIDDAYNVDFEYKAIEFVKNNPRFTELENKLAEEDYNWDNLTEEEQKEFEELSDEFNKGYFTNETTLKEIIDAQELFTAYPQLKDMKVTFEYKPGEKRGTYRNGKIVDEFFEIEETFNDIVIYTLPNSENKEYIKTILIHEIQHAIQDIEGFAKGGNKETARENAKKSLEPSTEEKQKSNWYTYYLREESAADFTLQKKRILKNPELIKKTGYWQAHSWLVPKKGTKEYKEYLWNRIYGWIEETENAICKGVYGYKSILESYNSKSEEELKKLRARNKYYANKYRDTYFKIWNLENKKKELDKIPSYELYQKFAGEVEARNVQERYRLFKANQQARQETLLAETEDVPRDEQIILFQEEQDVRNQYENTDKWLKAPNGNDTNLTEKQWLQVRTPSFKKWFGDWENDPGNASKVVDENGEPLVVYHGTSYQFDKFVSDEIGKTTKNKGIFGNGFYFSNSKEMANYYAKFDKTKEGKVLNTYLNIRNPFVWSDNKNIEVARKLGFPKDRIRDNKLLPLNDNEKIIKFTKKLKDVGYDGVIYNYPKNFSGYGDNNVNEIAVFSPNQIKSATDNSGEFNAENPSILFQTAYHGTPHNFDKFSTSAIGTGEGAQSFGWGLYFTNQEDIARWYADKLTFSDERRRLLNKKEYLKTRKKALRDVENKEKYEARILKNLKNEYKELNLAKKQNNEKDIAFYERLIKQSEEQLNNEEYRQEIIQSLQKDVEQIQNEIKELEKEIKTPKRNLYTVELPEGKYLYWDKTVTKAQKQQAYRLLEKAKEEGKTTNTDWRDWVPHLNAVKTGGDLYQFLSNYFMTDKDVSLALKSKGYIGIDYPANSLAGHTNEGKRNYVIFDENDVEIKEHINFQNEQSLYDPRGTVPKVRGGWTEKKIIKYLKDHPTKSGVNTAIRFIKEFDSPEELKEHMFYHGTAGGSDKLKPSITMSDREIERIGGGGYGEKYWSISVSKSKKVASNFAPMSSQVRIYPIILAKNAKVIEMAELTDSKELENHIIDLWNKGIDAVWIGDKNSGEQELSILNPQAVVNIGTADVYKNFGLGTEKNPLNIKNDEQIKEMFDFAKGLEIKQKEDFGAPIRPMSPNSYLWNDKLEIIGENPNYETEFEEYKIKKAQYQEDYNKWLYSEDSKEWELYERNKRVNILFQTEGELLEEARSFDSWQEWKEYVETFADSFDYDQVPKYADDTWYRTTWELANREPQQEGNTDENFIEYMSNRENLKDFLAEIANIDSIELWQPSDEAEAREIEELQNKKDIIDTKLAQWKGFARGILYGNELKESTYKNLETQIKNKPRDFRELFTQIMDNQTYAVSEDEKTSTQLQKKYKLSDVEVNEIENSSPEKRRQIARELSNKDIAERLANGTLEMGQELYDYIDSLNKEIGKLQEQYDQLENEVQEDFQRISNWEDRELLKLHEQLLEAKENYELKSDDVARKIERGIRVTKKYKDASVKAKANYDAIFKKFSDLSKSYEISNIAKEAMTRKEKISDIKKKLKAKQEEKRLSQEIKKLRVQLVKRTMRRIKFDTVNYEQGRQIIAIQRLFEPNLMGGINKWLGTEGESLRAVYSKWNTDTEYREKMKNKLANKKGGYDAIQLLDDTDNIAKFNEWTKGERALLYKVLPRENWIEELNLEELAEERAKAFKMDIGLREVSQWITNDKGENELVTMEVPVVSEEVETLVKDAIGTTLYNQLVSRPFAEWTTEEMESLAKRVNELYKEGRDELANKNLIRKQEAADIRHAIERAVKDTGIVINDDDSEEVKKKKLEKIAKILGDDPTLKGTSARRTSKWQKILEGYGDARLISVARLLDNNKEGINVSELYRKENDCYNARERKIKERTDRINKVMSDNKITLKDLYSTVKIDNWYKGESVTFTVDELLFMAKAAEDEQSKNAVMYGNLFSSERMLQDKQGYINNDNLYGYEAICNALYDKVLNEVKKLDPKFLKFADAISEDYAEQYERMNKVSIEEFNQPVNRVENYVPIVRLESSGDTNENRVLDDFMAGHGLTKKGVDKGMTKSRVEIGAFHQKPIELGLYKTWMDSVNRTEHFIAYSPYVRELNRVYKSQEADYTRQFIGNRYGQGMLHYIDSYIAEVANPNANVQFSQLDNLIRTLRGKTVPAYLAWKSSSIIKQIITSPMPFLQFCNPLEYLKASFDCIQGKTRDAIKEKSVFMRNRKFDPIQDLIKEQEEKNTNKVESVLNKFNSIGMKGLEAVDWGAVAPGWLACYRKKLNELNAEKQKIYDAEYFKTNDKKKAQEKANQITEDAAIQYADECVRLCQPSNRKVDLAPLFKESSEVAKAYLQFQTALNVIWNNIRYDLPYAIKNKQFKNIVGNVTGYVMAGLFMNLVCSGFDEDDEEEDKIKKSIFYATTQFTDAIPVLGSAVTKVTEKVITGESSYSMGTDLTPMVTKFMQGVQAIPKAQETGEWEKVCGKFAEAMGLSLGLPVSGVKEIKEVIDEQSLLPILGR